MPTYNNDNEKPKAGSLWFYNKETGEWSPMMQVESMECTINLADEAEAKLAEIAEPLGELEIVPREE